MSVFRTVLSVTFCSLLVLVGMLGIATYVASLPYPEFEYVDLLNQLQVLGYTFILPRDFNESTTNKTVVIVHDTDFSIHGIEAFLRVESQFHIKSGLYLRPDADYFSQSIRYFQQIEAQGWEIGFHYDSLSRSNGNKTHALTLFKAELDFMRQFFAVSTVRYHGDNYNLTISNRDLYNASIWRDLGIKEILANTTLPVSYIADTNKVWVQPVTLNTIVLVNLHSDWW